MLIISFHGNLKDYLVLALVVANRKTLLPTNEKKHVSSGHVHQGFALTSVQIFHPFSEKATEIVLNTSIKHSDQFTWCMLVLNRVLIIECALGLSCLVMGMHALQIVLTNQTVYILLTSKISR